jgi:multiple sugar transport system permease protein
MSTTTLRAPGARPGALVRRRRLRATGRRKWIGAAFAVPAIALFAAFAIYPMIRVFYISFFDYDLTSSPHWVGLHNYRYLMHSAEFHAALKATGFYLFFTYVPAVLLALLLAVGLDTRLPASGFIRLLYFAPVAMSWVAVSIIWRLVLQTDGLLNTVLHTHVNWLTSDATAQWALVITSIWKETGLFVILFLAGLQRIPPALHEAAALDGAGRIATFRHVTLPLLRPVTAVVCVMAVIRGCQSFSAQVVLTGGSFHTEVINLYVYKTAFESARMGRASAVAVLLFFALLMVTILQLRLFRSKER